MSLQFLRNVIFVALVAFSACARAELVHVYVETYTKSGVSRVHDEVWSTGTEYISPKAPEIDGFIFTHWSLSTAQAVAIRDPLCRALDQLSFRVYEETTLTAHYLPIACDTDGDGLSDGHEMYWYGALDVTPLTDSDGDGFPFVEELRNGMNPHLSDGGLGEGHVVSARGPLIQYNPMDLKPCVVACDPEGALFPTTTNYVKKGDRIFQCVSEAPFAYWTLNGIAQRDALGRALDEVSFAMPDEMMSLIAVCVTNDVERLCLHWYGTVVPMSSDTDGDGVSFKEELERGTNPLLPDGREAGGLACAHGPLVEYDTSFGEKKYLCVVRSEPGGALFTSVSNRLVAGSLISTAAYDAPFVFWTVNGVPQRDEFGRALDKLIFEMPRESVEVVAWTEEDADTRKALYWYGMPDVTMSSDTDGDGLSFAEELAIGTNPHLPDGREKGGLAFGAGDILEVNFQPYEYIEGVVVGEKYVEFKDLGTNIKPVVADVTGDGLWDLVLVCDGGEKVFVNVGSKGGPAFEMLRSEVEVDRGILEMNSTAKLEGMDLDVEPANALSATTWKDVLLVSDAEGRIWYYTPSSTSALSLRHKVWGGSFAGFAAGLRLAAVDWEDDGDLDCLCGTADGRLFLLRDPKVGRPTNLRALVGVDNVLLAWDPNAQSRVRGYRVYRGDEADVEGGGGELIADVSLPTYRDHPGAIRGYDYAVSSVSRFYTAGNSTPTVAESPRSEPVHVELGRVSLHWTGASARIGEQVTVMLSIDNSANLSPEMTVEIGYDRSKLNLLKTVRSALFEGDKIAPGSGKLYEYVFDVIAAEPCETEVRVTGAAMKGVGGAAVSPVLPAKGAVVTIAARSASVPYRPGDLTGDGIVDEADVRLMAKLKEGNGRKCTAEQLKAGDFNGNGRLDNADYQALRAMMEADKRRDNR